MSLRRAERYCNAEDGQVFSWGYPASGRLGNFFDTGSSQVKVSLRYTPLVQDADVRPMSLTACTDCDRVYDAVKS